LIIIDARSKSAAVANMAVGGGYEDYGGDFRILWMNIGRPLISLEPYFV
jgi:hypothetical protein